MTPLSLIALCAVVFVTVVFLACILAQFTARMPDDNGVIYDQPHAKRFGQNGWHN